MCRIRSFAAVAQGQRRDAPTGGVPLRRRAASRGGIDYGIYVGDVSTQSLHGNPFVKDAATFTFTGVSGFSEADIVREALFGLGTRPDSTGFVPNGGGPGAVPEPSSFALLALGLLGLGHHARRGRQGIA